MPPGSLVMIASTRQLTPVSRSPGDTASTACGSNALRQAVSACRGHIVSAAVFGVFVNVLMLTGPLFMLQVYDRVLASRSQETLVALLLLVTGLFAMMGVLDFVRGRVLARAGARIQCLLDRRVMDAVLRSSIDPGERARGSGAVRDVDALRQLLAGPALFALFDMPWTPFFLAIIYLFHPVLGLVATAGGALLILLALANQWRLRSPAAAAQRAGSAADTLGETLRQNAEAVQALGMREAMLSRWLRLRRAALGQQILASDRSGAYTAASRALRFYLQSLILAAGAWLVLMHQISPGMMVAASILLGRALAPVELAIAQWGLGQQALHGWRALTQLLQRMPLERPRTRLPLPTGVVQVQGVTVLDAAGAPLLRNVSFRVESGTALGVIGASGAGKTTLARALTGVWRPVAGKVRIDGAAIDQWRADEIGRHIGYLPQEISLISGTVADNISRMGVARDDREVVAAARRAGAHELLLALPQGYDTDIGAGGQSLSGGQRQRIALARALYGDPPILILDEPNANLDAQGEQALIGAIREAKARGRTVIVMAHRAGAIAACDSVLMLEKGAQLDFGPRDEVLARRAHNHARFFRPAAVAAAGAARGITGAGEGRP